jgi:hypothetical protein
MIGLRERLWGGPQVIGRGEFGDDVQAGNLMVDGDFRRFATAADRQSER